MADWLIGSHEALPECTFDVTVGATTESFSIAAGAYYLYADNGSLDLLDEFEDAVNGHSLIAGAMCFLQRDKMVAIGAGATSFSVTFTGDTTARDMMGFTGNLASATTHRATQQSPYFWSPGRAGSPDAQLGTHGRRVWDTVWGKSGPGPIRAVQHQSYRRNSWLWTNVDADLVVTASEENQEFYTFFETVCMRARRFRLYRDVNEDLSSTTGATFGSMRGPYQFVPKGSGVTEFDPERELEFVHVRNRIQMDVHQAVEYS